VTVSPTQLNNEEITKEYEAIEEILSREKYSGMQIKEHILKIGYKLEEVFRSSGNETFVSEISELILRTLRKRGLGHLRSSVYRMFDDFPQWKGDYNRKTIVSGETDLPEHFSILFEQAQHAYKVIQKEFDLNKLSKLPPEYEAKVKRQISNIYDLHDDVGQKFKILYEEKGWSTVDDDWDQLTESERLQRSERNHIKKPVAIPDAENPALQGVMEFNEEMKKVEQKLREYPIMDKDKSIRIGEAFRCLKQWMRPNTDNKWRADMKRWIEIVLGLKDYSIHHMSNLTKTKDIYGKLRHITKEQISDNQDKILKFNYELMKKIPGFFELSIWFEEASLPYRKELTNATSPKLSASA
jgi:hypothetical protein